jgi:hypothetical protein
VAGVLVVGLRVLHVGRERDPELALGARRGAVQAWPVMSR